MTIQDPIANLFSSISNAQSRLKRELEVPASTKNPKLNSSNPTDIVEVMAVYSKDSEDASVYMNKGQVSVLNEEN